MIHFSHGNSFPAETYHQVIKGLGKSGFEVGYISCLGHNPEYPVADTWESLVEELIEYITTHYNEKIIAVGHSLGGVISYWACLKRPDLFKAIILLDAPIYSSMKYFMINLVKYLGLVDYFTPAPNTKNRRYYWNNHQEAMDHFTNKQVFKNFDPRCLRDYVYFGTEEIKNEKGKLAHVKLRFDPLIEWKIYRTISMARYKTKVLAHNIPCGLLYGELSKVVSDKDANYMAKNYNIEPYKITKGGHLFPFEQPEATVTAIIDFLAKHNIS